MAHYILTALKGCVVKTFCLHIVAFLKTRALGERRPLPSADPDDPDSDPAFLFFFIYKYFFVSFLFKNHLILKQIWGLILYSDFNNISNIKPNTNYDFVKVPQSPILAFLLENHVIFHIMST